MDTQLKRGMLEACVLSVLQKGDSYGYQIIKEVAACVPISESTLYPVLTRLEGAGCLSTFTQEHNGRLRRYYQITPPGRQRLRDFLAQWQQVMQVYRFIEKNNQQNAGENTGVTEK